MIKLVINYYNYLLSLKLLFIKRHNIEIGVTKEDKRSIIDFIIII